jgi:hypothetical protein
MVPIGHTNGKLVSTNAILLKMGMNLSNGLLDHPYKEFFDCQ